MGISWSKRADFSRRHMPRSFRSNAIKAPLSNIRAMSFGSRPPSWPDTHGIPAVGTFLGCELSRRHFAEFVFVVGNSFGERTQTALFGSPFGQCQIYPPAQRCDAAFVDRLGGCFDQLRIHRDGQALFAHMSILTKVRHLSYS